MARAGKRGQKTELIKTYAQERNTGARTVYRNAEIHEEFFASAGKNGFADVLPDKGYYVAAIGSPDPPAVNTEQLNN